MRHIFCCSLKQIGNLLIAPCNWLLEKINAHQLIAYWRSRIILENQSTETDNPSLHSATTVVTDAKLELDKKQPDTELQRYLPDFQQGYSSGVVEYKSSSQNKEGSNNYFKTPRVHRTKLTTILRRLSIRNFMDYCVAALNEASNSGCSNKFELSSCNAPVWLLGRQYNLPHDSEQLTEDIRSKLWITYRRNFPPIDENTRYTTDRGFGCMIRCGQMVLANALLCKNLTRDWRWSANGLDANPQVYSKILRLFQDNENCLYSIHRIVQTGQKHEGKNIGEWFGPNTIAQALKKLSSSYQRQNQQSVDEEIIISIDAALDNVVIIDEIKSKFKKKNEKIASEEPGGGDNTKEAGEHWVPGILFIQLRLGLTKINPLYFAALKKTFQFKNSLGIIGGRPNHALYLVGYTEGDIIYLDPHNTQQYINIDEATTVVDEQAGKIADQTTKLNEPSSSPPYPQYEDLSKLNSNSQLTPSTVSASTLYQLTPDETYHCSSAEKMSIDRLDPSLALCFYFSSELEFDNWCNLSHESLVKSEQAPMFEITQSRPCDWGTSIASSITTKTVTRDRNNKSTSSSSDHDEEFEILT